jgi:hypothetical protein
MTEIIRNETIRYRNEGFAIHHLIADCPPFTVIRELLKNAEENAAAVQPAGAIEWFIEEIDGQPKLGLFNEGPGMAGEDLGRLMDLASTGKTLGLNSNYGQGGKISALKVSPSGVVYRSCKAGRVCQIVLAAEERPGMDFPVYVKRRQPVSDELGESWETVIDVTAAFVGREDRPLARDWTEVVLLGRHEAPDTIHELIPDMKVKNWLMRLINTRFYRFPPGVFVRHANIATGQPECRNAYGLEELTNSHSERFEDVVVTHHHFGPVTIRYCKLRGSYGSDDAVGHSRAKTMEAYGIGTRGDHICLVWKNECYEMHVSWSRISGAFGVTFGSANVAIQILLPYGAPVKNNTYRDAIIDANGSHQPVRVEEFAELVRANRPQWLLDYIEAEARKNTNYTGVMQRLRAFLAELKASAEDRRTVQPGGADQGEMSQAGGSGENGSCSGKGNGNRAFDPNGKSHRPAQGRRLPAQRPGIPNVYFTEDPAKLEEMCGRAAMFQREENAALLNPCHFKYLEDLERICADAGADAERRGLARSMFDEEYCFNAGKFVILAWLFKGKANWDDQEWEEALSMGALTVHLAGPDSLEDARRRFRQRLNSRKIAALGDSG